MSHPPPTHPDVGPALAGVGTDEYRQLRIAEAVEQLRVTREARRQLDAEDRAVVSEPEVLTLRDRLARPRLPVRYRIQGYQTTSSRVMLAAQHKAGKTTIVGNVIRCLVDGDRFLDVYEVLPVAGAICLLDFEMSPSQLDDWLAAQAIRHDDRVIPIPMRGRASAFNILDPGVRAEWAARLRELNTVYPILDCLRPVLDALGLDEHRDAGRFLVAFDALLHEAGIPEALIVQHMGHLAERARGDSRLRDWPDAEWRLVRQDDDPASPRFLTAYGRDVNVPERQLDYSPAGRRLTVAGGSRKDVKVYAALEAVLDVLAENADRVSGRAIWDALRESDHGRDTVYDALKLGVRDGRLHVVDGPHKSKLYRPVSECPAVSGQCPADSEIPVSECPGTFIGAGHRDTTRIGYGGIVASPDHVLGMTPDAVARLKGGRLQ